MPSSYPYGTDTFAVIPEDAKTSDKVGDRTHRDAHNDIADAIEAIQTELGFEPSGTYSSVRERLDANSGGTFDGTWEYTTVISSGTIDATKAYIIVEGDVTQLVLPLSTVTEKRLTTIKNFTGRSITVFAAENDSFDRRLSSVVVGPEDAFSFFSDGTSWVIV
jgi:hypothetical protein